MNVVTSSRIKSVLLKIEKLKSQKVLAAGFI